jgi:hypothetical protein
MMKSLTEIQAEEQRLIDGILNAQLTEEAETKMWAVMFTSRDDWDSPTVKFVKAKTQDEAFDKGLILIGYTENEVERMIEEGEHDHCVIEVIEDTEEPES